MNDHIENLLYESGITAQGCWDEMDQYDRDAVLRLVKLVAIKCVDIAHEYDAPKLSGPGMVIGTSIENYFDIEEENG